MVMAERPSAKTIIVRESQVKPGDRTGRVWDWGHSLTGNHSVFCVLGRGRGWSGELSNNLRAQWSTALVRVMVSGTEAYSEGCFPTSEMICLSEGWGKKSPAEKCHLQPDTGARAFTNLPVTVTA